MNALEKLGLVSVLVRTQEVMDLYDRGIADGEYCHQCDTLGVGEPAVPHKRNCSGVRLLADVRASVKQLQLL